jgi:hypothetical protein
MAVGHPFLTHHPFGYFIYYFYLYVMSALQQVEKEIREAYLFLREHNNTIPSETLEFMKDASLEKLELIRKNKDGRKEQEV